MIEKLKQFFHLFEYGRNFGGVRSSQWPTLRDAHIKANPFCIVCGKTKGLEAHHIRPFHLHPELELDPTNLVTLCTQNQTINCHLRFGHWGNFMTKYNPTIKEDAAKWSKRFTSTLMSENL